MTMSSQPVAGDDRPLDDSTGFLAWHHSGVLVVVNNGTHFLAELESALGRLAIGYDIVSGHEPLELDALDSFSGVILTGGVEHVFRPQELETLAVSLRIIGRATVPILGICLGHQLLARHYGGGVEPLPTPLDRMETIERTMEDPLFAGLPVKFAARVAHGDGVTDIASPLVSLARSETSELEAIRHESFAQYGLQFHPEASGDSGMAILRNFGKICGESS